MLSESAIGNQHKLNRQKLKAESRKLIKYEFK